MRTRWITIGALTLAAVVPLGTSAAASAATKAQYGAKCNDAWTGKRGTPAFRTYKRGCIAAATAATAAAHAAGDNDVASANAARARAACAEAFPAPRTTAAKRKAYRLCVKAATTAQKVYGGRPLTATLAGDATTDADGAGTARFTLNQGRKQICYDVSWTNLDVVQGLHIHRVADNSIAVALDVDTDLTDGNAKGCVNELDPALIKSIRQHPEQYYVNVHSVVFVDGAIRGTLTK